MSILLATLRKAPSPWAALVDIVEICLVHIRLLSMLTPRILSASFVTSWWSPKCRTRLDGHLFLVIIIASHLDCRLELYLPFICPNCHPVQIPIQLAATELLSPADRIGSVTLHHIHALVGGTFRLTPNSFCILNQFPNITSPNSKSK